MTLVSGWLLIRTYVLGTVGGMLGDTNLSDVHDVERLRRSLAMLSPKAAALNREEALAVVTALGSRLSSSDRTE